MLLKPKLKKQNNESNQKLNLVIMCGPNGSPYEFFTYSVFRDLK